MATNPLKKAISSGIRMNERIGDLFAGVGTSEHPRGSVLTDYRNARRLLQSALKENNRIGAVTDVLRTLRRNLQADISSSFSDAIELGSEESKKQLGFYDIKVTKSIRLTDETQTALDAVLTRFDSQSAAIRALVLTDADDMQILGDEDRVGVLSASEITAAAAYWATFLIWNAFDQSNTINSGLNFQKQAVAAIDMRTTDCCLRVHGQIQPFNKPFKLTGTPRFADEMDHPGFHWWCRTSEVLYLAEYDDGFTKQMRDSARFFLSERAAGRNPDRNPADAFA